MKITALSDSTFVGWICNSFWHVPSGSRSGKKAGRKSGLSWPALAIMLIFCARSYCAAPTDSKLVKLEFEIEALSKLQDFEVTPTQLKTLSDLSASTAAKMPAAVTEKTSASYATALQN